MKKLLFVVSLVATLGVGYVHAQSQSDSIDMVVLVDTSESMLPYWKDTTNYIIRNILTGVLHKGDTFHLISFASQPELEISRKIESEKDIQAILARYLLLQPLGHYTDLVAGIQYLYQYVIDLPLASEKKIIILTDGIDDPPPGSSFPLRTASYAQDIKRNRQIITETAQAMRRLGWQIHIVQYPIAGSATASANQPGAQLLGQSGTAGTGSSGGGSALALSGQAGGAAGQGGGTAGAGSSGGATAGSGSTGTAAAGQGGSGTSGQGTAAGQGAGGTSGQGATAGQAGGAGSSAAGTSAMGAGSGGTGAGSQAQGGAAGGGTGANPAGSGSPGGGASSGGAGGKAPLLTDLSKTLGVPIQQFEGVNKQDLANIATGSPLLVFPKNLGKIGYKANAPFVIRNFRGQPILVQLTGIIYDGRNILARPVNQPVGAKQTATMSAPIKLPVSLAPGAHTIAVDLQFRGTQRVSPHTGQLAFTLSKGAIEVQGLSFYALPVLFGIIFIAVVVLIVIFIRRIVSTVGAAPSASITPRVRYSGPDVAINAIELRVSGQNPNIGGRNIHPIGSGTRRTVGGGGSTFLIYLYPCPPHLGEIVCDGDRYSFVPTSAEHFPDLSGELVDCLDKPIRVRIDDNREVVITFRRYISPLDEVNRIMHLVDKAGTPARTT